MRPNWKGGFIVVETVNCAEYYYSQILAAKFNNPLNLSVNSLSISFISLSTKTKLPIPNNWSDNDEIIHFNNKSKFHSLTIVRQIVVAFQIGGFNQTSPFNPSRLPSLHIGISLQLTICLSITLDCSGCVLRVKKSHKIECYNNWCEINWISITNESECDTVARNF